MPSYENIRELECWIDEGDLPKKSNIKCVFTDMHDWVRHVKEPIDNVQVMTDMETAYFSGWFDKPKFSVIFTTPTTCESIGEIHRHDNKEHFTLQCRASHNIRAGLIDVGEDVFEFDKYQ